MAENREKNIEKREANLIPFKKGKSGNPKGRPLGQRNFATIYKEALIKFAEMNDMEPDQMETDILLKALASSRKGDYRFWKDIHDRIHGQPKQPMDLKIDGEIAPVLVKIIRDGDKRDSN